VTRASNSTGNIRAGSIAFLSAVVLCGVTGCSDDAADPSTQTGPNPTLPEPQQYLVPPMNLAKVVGWSGDETPTVPQGVQIRAMASELSHPRSLYTLPNGDVLVIESQGPGSEPIKRPKDLVMGFLQSLASSGGGGEKPTNQITMLRDTDGDGVPETRSVFLDHLNSPFGVALVGTDFYVANTDAIVRYSYTPGATKISDPGVVLTPLPGGPINHHWTKVWQRAPTARCCMSASGRTATSRRTALRRKKTAPRSGKSIDQRADREYLPVACAIQTTLPLNRKRARCGPP